MKKLNSVCNYGFDSSECNILLHSDLDAPNLVQTGPKGFEPPSDQLSFIHSHLEKPAEGWDCTINQTEQSCDHNPCPPQAGAGTWRGPCGDPLHHMGASTMSNLTPAHVPWSLRS